MEDQIKITIMDREYRQNLKDTDIFKRTNKIWNDMGFNRAFMIGYVMSIVNGCTSREEFISRYFESGKERLRILDEVFPEVREANMDYANYLVTKEISPYAVKKYNNNYGRTLEELGEIAFLFYQALNSNEISVSLNDAMAMVIIRIFDETWLGYEREINVLNDISNELNVTSMHSNIKQDSDYAVDGFLIDNEKIFCGIQIKPISYLSNEKYLTDAQVLNKRKNGKFVKEYGVPIIYAYYDRDNFFVNKDEVLFLANHARFLQKGFKVS